MSYTAEQLDGYKPRELVQIGRDKGLRFNKNHNKAERIRRILSKQAETLITSAPPLRPDAPPSDLIEAKPGFESLIDGDTCLPPGPGSGGAREGAGRPQGTTAEIAAVRRLSNVPHPVVRDLLESMFQAWAAAVKCPDVALTKDEAVDLALPWTNVLELAGVAQKIPPWLTAVVGCIWTTANVVKSKSKLAREAVQARKAVASQPVEAKAA